MNALLLSGGLESAALCLLHRPDLCITVDYGQPALAGELKSARFFAKYCDLRHLTVEAPAYPHKRSGSWWPFRNQLLVSAAAAATAKLQPKSIMIGLVATDIYSDCKPGFLNALNELFAAQNSSLKVVAPALHMTTLELLSTARFPSELLDVTFSCHRMPHPCGACPGCLKSKSTKTEYLKSLASELTRSQLPHDNAGLLRAE